MRIKGTNTYKIIARVYEGYGFSSSHAWMWELKAEHQRNDAFELFLEKTLESPLDCKKIQPVHHKGDQSWVFIGRTDVEAETPILWPPHVKSWLIVKDPDAGRDWGQEEKGTTKDEMAGWHHWLDGHGFGWTPGVGNGQGGLACCDLRGCKESDTIEWLNWTELMAHSKCLINSNAHTHPKHYMLYLMCSTQAYRNNCSIFPIQLFVLESPWVYERPKRAGKVRWEQICVWALAFL